MTIKSALVHINSLLLQPLYHSLFLYRVIEDMDEPTNKLMGMYGYCTQVRPMNCFGLMTPWCHKTWLSVKTHWRYWSFVWSHCGLVMPYGNIYPGQHWLNQCLVAWQLKFITRTNVTFQSESFIGFHLREISLDTSTNTKIRLKITTLEFHLNLSGAMS